MRIVGDKFIQERIDELKIMKENQDNRRISSDYEDDHVRADDILCEVLERAGLKELVEAYKSTFKYYV